MTRGLFMTCCWLFSSESSRLFFLPCINILTCFCQTPFLTHVWSCRHLSAQHACAPQRYYGTSPIFNIFHDTFVLFLWWEEPGRHQLRRFLLILGLQAEQLSVSQIVIVQACVRDSELEKKKTNTFFTSGFGNNTFPKNSLLCSCT